MASVNVYLTFEGNCEDAFNFYKSVFGGDFEMVSRFNEMPPGEDVPAMPESEGNKIMHISLPIGGGTSIYGSDTGGEWSGQTVVGNNFSISVTADSKEEADKIYDALSAGGQSTMPMADTFWGSYFGMLTDKFKVNWMVGFG
jgi:PhnB protein